MDLAGKSVIVVGLGKSGLAAADLCQRLGARVLGTDSRPLAELSPEMGALGIDVRAGGHEGVQFSEADYVIVSPGVPEFAALREAERAGAVVIGELELACRQITEKYPDSPIVAVGGTNGKSTTTTLVAGLLAAAGQNVFAGANLGTPASAALISDQSFDAYVLEVSSFQLERAPEFRPRVSVLLNVTDDHLDRYDSFADYASAKGNAFVNQTSQDIAIIPYGDAECGKQAARGAGQVITFGERGDYVVSGRELVEVGSGVRVSLDSARLHGMHNLHNAAAAFATVRALGASETAIASGLAEFQPLAHRMVLVGELGQVRFYDDSKATNVGAAVTALLGLSEARGVLIAGGRDKLGSYEPLVSALAQKGRAVVVIGEAAEKIAEALGQRVPLERASSMQDAVARAFRLACPGDAVLLSPACASFDMFKSYADRGEHFVRAFVELSQTYSAEAAPS